MASPAVMEPPGLLMYSQISPGRVLRFEEEELGDDQVGEVIFDLLR